MKKIFYSLITISILNLSLLAGMVVSPDTLPKKAQDFIKANFPKETVTYVEKDMDDYEVKLSNGSEITFLLNGEWKDVEGQYSPIPTKFIPSNVLNTVKSNHPSANIVKIEKNWNNYEIKLDNMMELYIDFNGKLIGQKFDD